jgi:methylated-DNA-protein-cysteine methyltransferase-like protein
MKASGGTDDGPWQRVINRLGSISARGEVGRPIIQEQLLKKEGVIFDESGVCDLEVYRWEPSDPDDFYYGPSRNAPF